MMTTFELVRAKAEAAHKAAGALGVVSAAVKKQSTAGYGGCASGKNGFYY